MTARDERKQRFEALFRRHYGRVHRYVLRRADAAVADDVASETFTVAWRRLEDVPDEELPWLLGVARRTLANHTRSQRRQEAVVTQLARQAHSQAVSDRPEHAILHALTTLGEKDREALLLVAWEGLAPAEAARALGTSLPGFHLRTFRARRRLRQALEQERAPHRHTRENVVPAKEVE